jgi:hypothetical protein
MYLLMVALVRGLPTFLGATRSGLVAALEVLMLVCHGFCAFDILAFLLQTKTLGINILAR